MLSYRCIYWFSVDIERKELSQIFSHYLLNEKSIFRIIAILKKAVCENRVKFFTSSGVNLQVQKKALGDYLNQHQ